MAGPHVFEDGRLGLWIVNLPALGGRLARLRELGFTDLFVNGPAGTTAIKSQVLGAGFLGCHAWWAVDGLTAHDYAVRCLADISRWSPGAGDLNIELGNDAALGPYLRQVVGELRAARRSYRLRLNVAARKAGFLPIDLLQSDANLYACEQNYAAKPGLDMAARFSEADVLDDLIAAGVPRVKAAVCYGAAITVGGKTGDERVCCIPQPPAFPIRRGVVFQDNLLADAGLL